MDIITHTMSGVAVSTVAIPFVKKFDMRVAIIATGALGGALPDIDAISLWSGFDRTFGRFFGLSHRGSEIYFGKLWYSHHNFFHSIAAAVLFTIILFGIIVLAKKIGGKRKGFAENLKLQTPLLLAFFVAFVIHLFEDMPTPSCVWGGVNLFWPSKNFVGGTGSIWWWNNYDIFLIVVLCIAVNAGFIVFLKKLAKAQKLTTLISVIVFISLAYGQIKSRPVDFNYTGFTKKFGNYEQKSLEIQQEKLSKPTYKFMRWFDRKVRVNF